MTKLQPAIQQLTFLAHSVVHIVIKMAAITSDIVNKGPVSLSRFSFIFDVAFCPVVFFSSSLRFIRISMFIRLSDAVSTRGVSISPQVNWIWTERWKDGATSPRNPEVFQPVGICHWCMELITQAFSRSCRGVTTLTVRRGHVQDNIRRVEISAFLMGVRYTLSDGRPSRLTIRINQNQVTNIDQEMPTPPRLGCCCCCVHSSRSPTNFLVTA